MSNTRRPVKAVATTPANRKLRLLNVTVQARFVVDDGETLTEIVGPPATVVASAWPDFAAKSFTNDDLTRMLQHFDATAT